MSYGDYVKTINNADIYLDSLPMAGGTALPEVRAMGVPVTGLATGALGYTPFDKTKVATLNELVAELGKYVAGENNRIEDMNNSRTLIAESKKIHSSSEVKKRYESILLGENQSCPVGNFFDVDLRFYEKQWLERNKVNISVSLIYLAIEQYRKGQGALLQDIVRVSVS